MALELPGRDLMWMTRTVLRRTTETATQASIAESARAVTPTVSSEAHHELWHPPSTTR
jgi:hypothetical protein